MPPAAAKPSNDNAGDVSPWTRLVANATRDVMRFDVSRRPAGVYLGGDRGRTVLCTVCGRGGILLAPTRRIDGMHARVAHVIVFMLDAKNEARVRYENRCIEGIAYGLTAAQDELTE